VQPEPQYWPRVDDPRWIGSVSKSWPLSMATAPHVTFRALRWDATKHLYLSWVARVAPKLAPGVDKLRLAMRTTTNTWVIEVLPFNNVDSDVNEVRPTKINLWRLDGAGSSAQWTPITSPPAGLREFTSVWLNKATPARPNMWAISMRVPMTAPLKPLDMGNLETRHAFAFHLHVNHGDSTLAEYQLDNTIDLADNDEGKPKNTEPDDWSSLDVSLPPSHPTCKTDIRLAASDIGIAVPGASSLSHEIKLTGDNTFHVKPLNVMMPAASAPEQTIRAAIRIANWGTKPDMHDVCPPPPPPPIPPPPCTVLDQLWKRITPEDPQQEPFNQVAIPPNQQGTIVHTRELSPDERCEFTGGTCANPGSRLLHQCMLVELHGGQYIFSPDSVVRNMDFVSASTFGRRSEVSVAGLKPIVQGERRDVYLYLQTFGMPGNVREPAPPSGMYDLVKVEAAASKSDRARYQRPSDFETLTQVHPTYLVHAFHDTGKAVTVNGIAKHVLRPQTSFGYDVHHDGPLSGWEAAIEGAERIAENYYRISVPENGAETINTRIVARQFAVWLGLGQTEPLGSFGARNKRGWAGTLGLEYLVADAITVEGMLGVHHFGHRSGASDIDVTHLGIGGKWSWFVSGVTPFVVAGAGVYAFDPGSTKFGAYAGGGVQLSLAPAWQLEGRYLRHRVASNTPYSDYATLQIALRHEF